MDPNTCYNWRSDRRWYAAELGQDLFGDWVVWCYWGGRNSLRGGTRCYLVTGEQHGREFLQNIDKRRQQRKYVRV